MVVCWGVGKSDTCFPNIFTTVYRGHIFWVVLKYQMLLIILIILLIMVRHKVHVHD